MKTKKAREIKVGDVFFKDVLTDHRRFFQVEAAANSVKGITALKLRTKHNNIVHWQTWANTEIELPGCWGMCLEENDHIHTSTIGDLYLYEAGYDIALFGWQSDDGYVDFYAATSEGIRKTPYRSISDLKEDRMSDIYPLEGKELVTFNFLKVIKSIPGDEFLSGVSIRMLSDKRPEAIREQHLPVEEIT